MEETIEPIKSYHLYLKSHCEAPDFEVWVEATSTQDAAKKLREQYGRQLCDVDDRTLVENLGVDN